MRAAAIPLLALLVGAHGSAQTPEETSTTLGAQVFARDCAACHVAANDARAPSLEAMRGLDPAAVLASLESGKMAVQGERLSLTERRGVAEFLTGRAVTTATARVPGGACTMPSPLAESLAAPAWNGWGNGAVNTRFQRAECGPRGRGRAEAALDWAFGFPGVLAARTQPAVVGGRVFTASEAGDVFALDARTGCTHWVYRAARR